mgnify:CR=1 FL=1
MCKKTYHMGEVEIHAVDGVDFEINEGEFVVIVGPSGAGKNNRIEYSSGEWTRLQADTLSLTVLISARLIAGS